MYKHMCTHADRHTRTYTDTHGHRHTWTYTDTHGHTETHMDTHTQRHTDKRTAQMLINFRKSLKGLRWIIKGMGRAGGCITFILDILFNLQSLKTTKIESQVIIR